MTDLKLSKSRLIESSPKWHQKDIQTTFLGKFTCIYISNQENQLVQQLLPKANKGWGNSLSKETFDCGLEEISTVNIVKRYVAQDKITN